MSTWVLVGIGALVVGFVAAGSARTDGYKGGLKRARRGGEIAPLVEAIERSPGGDQVTRWDHAVSTLWQAYERETAALLIMEGLRRTDADVLHYWMQKVLEVEPEIAAEVLDRDELVRHFRPQAAARCGRAGVRVRLTVEQAPHIPSQPPPPRRRHGRRPDPRRADRAAAVRRSGLPAHPVAQGHPGAQPLGGHPPAV